MALLTILSGEQILNWNELMASTWSNAVLHFLSWRAASRSSCFLGLSQTKPELIYFSMKNCMSYTFSRDEHCLWLNFLGSIRPCTQAKYGLLPTSGQHILREKFHVWVGTKEIFHVRLFIYLLVAALWSAQGSGMQVCVLDWCVCKQMACEMVRLTWDIFIILSVAYHMKWRTVMNYSCIHLSFPIVLGTRASMQLI